MKILVELFSTRSLRGSVAIHICAAGPRFFKVTHDKYYLSLSL